MSKVIKGGTVVTADLTYKADVKIDGDVIVEIGPNLTGDEVLDASGWTDAQFRAFVIADNKLAEAAGWDEELLRLELGDLQGMGFDLELIGFDAVELGSLLEPDPKAGLTDDDAAPELQATP